MTLSLMLFALAVSVLLISGAWLAAALLRPVGVATRHLWFGALLLTSALVITGPMRAGSTEPQPGAPSLLARVDVFAVDAALSGATRLVTRLATRVLPRGADPALRTLWFVASLAALSFFAAGASRHRRVLARSQRARVAGSTVRVSDDFGPAVIGVLSPTVVLPRWLLSRTAEEQALVVRHEAEHIAVRDPALLVAGAACVVLMPWNPLMWWALARLRLAMELDCDARVLRSGAPPMAYGSLLLDLTAALPPVRLGAAAFAARPSQLEQRIVAMSLRPATARQRHAAFSAAALTGLVVVIAACSADVDEGAARTTTAPVAVTATGTADAAAIAAAAKPGASLAGSPYFDFQVEKPVQQKPGSGAPRYPAILRSAGVEGEVLAQFVVGTDGVVETGSLKIVRSSHALFEQSVRDALPSMRFTPATIGGEAVRQLVQQPFVYQLAK